MSAEALCGGEAASLSLGHNCAQAQCEATPNLPFRLTGSQAKTARALEVNVDRLISEAGIERVGFLTLTVGNYEGAKFVQVHDAAEASRRIHNLARRFLPSISTRWAIVTERHKSGAIHFHLIAQMKEDIRAGYEWDACRAGDYRSACHALRRIWAVLRSELPNHGFGRAQLEPLKNGEAASRYVAKYVEKNLFNRLKSDIRKKLVRYGGWEGTHCRSNDLCWSTPKACEWRRKVRAIAATAKVWTPQAMAAMIGPRWAWRVSGTMFDLALEGWSKPGDREWHEGDMTRDQAELAADFMRRDADSFKAGQSRMSNLEKQIEAFERQLTEAEMERLKIDLEDLAAWRERDGLGEPIYFATKGAA